MKYNKLFTSYILSFYQLYFLYLFNLILNEFSKVTQVEMVKRQNLRNCDYMGRTCTYVKNILRT